MAKDPDVVRTYILENDSRAYEIPEGATSVCFVATMPLWATGGADDTVAVTEKMDNAAYIQANTPFDISFDQSLTPWFAIKPARINVSGFVTAIWKMTKVK